MATENTRGKLADYAHNAWSGWMRYLFAKCLPGEAGALTIPADYVQRWARQMGTPYDELSPGEQRSDIAEADKILELLGLDGPEVKRGE